MTPGLTFPTKLPDRRELPDEDGTFVKNFQEHPQSIILTDSIGTVLQKLHPDGQYAIGQDEERATVAERERDRATERAQKAERSQREAISRLANMGFNSAQIAEVLNVSLAEVKAIARIES